MFYSRRIVIMKKKLIILFYFILFSNQSFSLTIGECDLEKRENIVKEERRSVECIITDKSGLSFEAHSVDLTSYTYKKIKHLKIMKKDIDIKVCNLKSKNSFLSVRQEPSISSKEISRLYLLDDLTLKPEDLKKHENNWYYVTLSNSQKGWAYGEYLCYRYSKEVSH